MVAEALGGVAGTIRTETSRHKQYRRHEQKYYKQKYYN